MEHCIIGDNRLLCDRVIHALPHRLRRVCKISVYNLKCNVVQPGHQATYNLHRSIHKVPRTNTSFLQHYRGTEQRNHFEEVMHVHVLYYTGCLSITLVSDRELWLGVSYWCCRNAISQPCNLTVGKLFARQAYPNEP